MIGRLTGRLASKSTDHVVLDVAGVGYLVHIPLSTFYELPEAESPASLWIHTHVREDTLALYGFLTERERSLFLLLLGVAGIGPKVALTVLSGIPPSELVEALCKQDIRRLVAVPGVGKKTAERLIVELKDKMPAATPDEVPQAPASGRPKEDLLSALVNLGYSRGEVERGVDRALHEDGSGRFEDLLRRALQIVAGR